MSGTSATDIVINGLTPGLKKVGEKFKTREYFLSELIFAAHIMNRCMKVLEPKLKEDAEKTSSVGKAVIGTVKGDLHDIGKNVFITLMRSSGFDVIDLGVDVSSEKFVEVVKKHKPEILGMSALLTTTVEYFKIVIDALNDAGLRDKLYIMIGGPPHVSSEEVGADIYCNNAFVGVEKALEHMTRTKMESSKE